MTIPDPLGVQIGAREIYDKVSDVAGKVDRLVDQHTDLRTDLVEMRADHETRIRALERRSVTKEEVDARGRRTIAVVAVIVAAAGVLVTLVFQLISAISGGP